MRYRLRVLAEQAIAPLQSAMELSYRWGNHRRHPLANTRIARYRNAILESSIRLLKTYPKRSFHYEPISIDGQLLPVNESVVASKPFCELRRFSTARTDTGPKLLFVAAMSGHHATLSKDTLREFLPEFDVYITDWVDARQVPLSAGHFGFEEYVEYLIRFLEVLGPNVHVVGLCQAAVPALCATAVMAAENHVNRPRTLSLLAGPIDVRVKRNAVTRHIGKLPLAAMRVTIHTVPSRYPGAGRRVYPGYLQLFNFVSLNPRNHLRKHLQFFKDVASDNHVAAEKHRQFYDEYNAMMDCTAEFYLETLERVFFDQHLPKGRMKYKGRAVHCDAIRDVALLTIEGKDDDMVAVGVTKAAHDLCAKLPDHLRAHHLQAGVGHYGIFNGSIFKEEIAPCMRDFMRRHSTDSR